MSLFLFALFNRSPLGLDVIRDRNAIYRETSGGQIETVYTLKILNKSESDQQIDLTVEGLGGASLETDPPLVVVPAGELASVVARVRVPRDAAGPGGHDLMFVRAAGRRRPAGCRDPANPLYHAHALVRMAVSMNMPDSDQDKPWYRHLWPWLAMLPPAAAVIGGLTTVWLAGGPPALVVDDYADIARVTVERAERDRRASELGLSAEFSLQALSESRSRS